MTITLDPPTRSVEESVKLIRHPQPGQLVVAAHRGLRCNQEPDNSKVSILNAARQGCHAVEVDVQTTKDGHIVILHDEGLGRVTNIAEYLGKEDIYSPFTGRGYHPRVDQLNWNGCIEHLKLKGEYGDITEEPVLELKDLLDFIKEEALELLVLLDFKSKDAMEASYHVLKDHTNARGVCALRWNIYKPDVKFCPSPAELEGTTWWNEAASQGALFIPVLEPASLQGQDALAIAQDWASRPYVLSLEVGLRAPNGPLQDVVNWVQSSRRRLSMGFFAALAGMPLKDRERYKYDLGSFDPDIAGAAKSPPCYSEWRAIGTYDDILLPGESPSGRDERGDVDTWCKMGYSWVIADGVPPMLPIIHYQKDLVATS